MGYQTIDQTDIQYGLICFDANGHERPEESGLMSQRLIEKVSVERATDVFFFCHGWKGDVPAAIQQFDKWIKAFATSSDAQKAARVFPNFRPFFIGLHWPSLPFGDEEIAASSFAVEGAPPLDPEQLIESCLERLGGAPELRPPLEVILAEARHNCFPDKLPPDVVDSYLQLNEALGLKSGTLDAPPDADREPFDPQLAYQTANSHAASFGGGFNLGGILAPLRQLSYWTMKARARTIGEGGMHNFLKALLDATSAIGTRVHLMGHSFGTVVVSSMIGGPNASGTLPRPVNSVTLVQGAVSLWCYAASIPFADADRGYFNPILNAHKVIGPIITTQSKFDYAVGRFYPIASRLKGVPSFAAGFPKFGGIGTYGIQGVPDDLCSGLDMLAADGPYHFEPGKIYNLNASQFIKQIDGASGAHSDIAGPEVAHAMWSAVISAEAARRRLAGYV